ncbi:MAG: hypothetical protein ACQERF_08170 [Actinomycetota bacterium]
MVSLLAVSKRPAYPDLLAKWPDFRDQSDVTFSGGASPDGPIVVNNDRSWRSWSTMTLDGSDVESRSLHPNAAGEQTHANRILLDTWLN